MRIKLAIKSVLKVLACRCGGGPLLLSHLVTRRCNCRCPMCLWVQDGGGAAELTAREIDGVYRQAADLGFIALVVWGGEPFVRHDLQDILKSARRCHLSTTLITNGFFLAKRAEDISPFVDGVIVSIDNLGHEHDRLRGQIGLFEAALAGIRRIRAVSRAKVILNVAVSRLNVSAVEPLARLAAGLGVGLYLCPIETGEGRPDFDRTKPELGLDEKELDALCRQILDLKRQGCPINNSRTYLRTFIGGRKPYRCHEQKVCVTLDANGDVRNCLSARPFGNVRTSSLASILGSDAVQQARRQSELCHVCNNPDVIDCSYVWELRPESLWSYAKVLLR